MKKLLLLFFVIIILQSCNILNFNNCKKYHTDSIVFRAHSEAMSTNIQFAEEKALLLAKKVIAEDIDNYIIEKCNYKSFLSDSEFEDKITIARNTILSDIKIICSKTMKKGEMYKSFIAVEISKEDVDKEISGRLNK